MNILTRSPNRRRLKGVTLLEVSIVVAVSGVVLFCLASSMEGTQDIVSSETSRDAVDSGATRLLDRLGKDVRESSYAYIFAGDWLVLDNAGSVDIEVARNYFSSTPTASGVSLPAGITNEGWAQCTNAVCGWSSVFDAAGAAPQFPNAFLTQPFRNNAQTGGPLIPPPSLQFSAQEARGRLYGHLDPGDACPVCGNTLSADAQFSGLMLLSPRMEDQTFSYVDGGNEPQWESMVFYCPFRRSQSACEMRRYVFYAETYNAAASLIDLLDFDGSGIIESPPMTDASDDFVLDADGEGFSLLAAGDGDNDLFYTRWDTAAGRSFSIQVDRATGVASVTVSGGLYGTGVPTQIQLEMKTYARGLTDFEVSTYINNPSWDVLGVTTNPTGVAELWAVRASFQIDRSSVLDLNQRETVQSTMFRPRN